MLHAIGYWRPNLATFPEAPKNADRTAAAAYARDYAVFDDETIAAVDKFRTDKKLDYQGDAAGLVDQRLVDALKAAYLEKRKSR
jgi:hypothetical protein